MTKQPASIGTKIQPESERAKTLIIILKVPLILCTHSVAILTCITQPEVNTMSWFVNDVQAKQYSFAETMAIEGTLKEQNIKLTYGPSILSKSYTFSTSIYSILASKVPSK